MTGIPLHQAAGWAERIVAELRPFCEQIMVAGSIRRARPVVNDVDLVVLPKEGQLEALRARCKLKAKVLQDGCYNLIVQLQNGLQVDLFFAVPERRTLFSVTPTNWGSILLCRTGSRDHNVKLCQAATARGLKWKTMLGVCRVHPETDEPLECLASETEEDIFSALGMNFVPPALREIRAP